MGELYIVATPIGNLEDMTLGAIRVLKEADIILCEDTRTTKRLLDKYEIKVKTFSYNAHSTPEKAEKIFEALEAGKKIALVSDAGTPAISDPGSLIVAQVREKFGSDIKIIPVPGPSAVISALSISGAPSSDFLFLGFLPHKKGRETLVREIAESERTVALYESTHRIIKLLESFEKFIPERKIFVARELTKMFEEGINGLPEEVHEYFKTHPEKVRGEFVVVIFPK